jgi:hypothetical protein
MAEAGRAPETTPSTLTVNIDGNYNCSPKNGKVHNDGEVTFHVAPNNGCYIYTDPADAFVGEASNGCLELGKGDNTFTVNVADTTINYCTCETGGTCNPSPIKEGGGNTIQVDSSMGGDRR